MKMAKKRKNRRSASKSALGCLFWIGLAAVLGIAAYAAREPIQKAFSNVFKPVETPAPSVTVKPLAETEKETPAPAQEKPSPAVETPKSGMSAETEPGKTPQKGSAKPETRLPETPAPRKIRLFFANVDAQGAVSVKGVIRTIPASDSPLLDTILTLLKGPTSQEMNVGLLTMIPSETRLLGAVVRGETAYLDFSESFRFNTLGAEGLNAQLKQVVYAATEFPTVKNVQFLIEGKKVQYLGSEGIRIDSPLDRQSFTD